MCTHPQQAMSETLSWVSVSGVASIVHSFVYQMIFENEHAAGRKLDLQKRGTEELLWDV